MPHVSRRALAMSVAVVVLAAGTAVVGYMSRGTQAVVTEKGEESLPVTMGEEEGRKQQAKFVPGDIIVKFRDRASVDRASASVGARSQAPSGRNLDGLLRHYNVQKSAKVFQAPLSRARSPGAPVQSATPKSASRAAALEDSLKRYVKLETAEKTEQATLALIEDLKTLPEVESAEPNYIAEIFTVPNDPYYLSSGAWGQSFRDLWGLQNIQAEQAWDLSQGEGVTVAVTDTGIDLTHEDITQNMWTNPGEVGKCSNRIDDDGNGYIDDCWGWDFHSNDNNPMDDHGHGTHVAGTIAAVGNNGKGIIGVAPKAKVMALKGLDRDGSGDIDRLTQAIVYAADNGAKVINASWGCQCPVPPVLIDAIDYAHDVKDVVFVAAAGNSNADMQKFAPANLPDAIAVAASDHLDQKASFSNYGVKIDVTAPGGGDPDPPSAYEPSRSILSLKSSQAGSGMTGNGQLVIGGLYLRQAGTSMAAPHVAGVAALVRSLHPEWTAEQVRQAIRVGADDVGTPGFDTQSGYGRLQVHNTFKVTNPLSALLESLSVEVGATTVPITGSAYGPNFESWILEYGKGNIPSSWLLITSSTAPVTRGLLTQWDLSAIADGSYTVRLTAIANIAGSRIRFESRRPVVIDTVSISSPSRGDPKVTDLFRGGSRIDITGTVATPGLQSYMINIIRSDGTHLKNPAITLANGGTQKVWNGLLASWDTSGVPADAYLIHIFVFANRHATEISRVIVDPNLHPHWPVRLTKCPYSLCSLPNHLTAADVNGDGKAELIIGLESTVTILQHDGSPLPGWPQMVERDTSGINILVMNPVVGDMDGDGTLEVVASDARSIFVWRADGTPFPGWPQHGFDRAARANIALADMDGDGRKEIILVLYNGTVHVLSLEGRNLPGWPRAAPGSWMLYHNIAVGDVDNDGKNELVLHTYDASLSTPPILSVFRSDGQLLPGWPKTLTSSAIYRPANAPVVGDVNGDGVREIVVGGLDGAVYVFRADGTLLPGWPQVGKNVLTSTPALGDIDGDGRADVVVGYTTVTHEGRDANFAYAWKGDGTLLPGWPIQYGRYINYSFFGYGPPVIADVDGDGQNDVVASNDFYGHSPFPLSGYSGNGAAIPGFPKPALNWGADQNNTAAIADMDGDGLLELAWIDSEQIVYMWDLPAPASAPQPWPMFQHDAQHTGCLDCNRSMASSSSSSVSSSVSSTSSSSSSSSSASSSSSSPSSPSLSSSSSSPVSISSSVASSSVSSSASSSSSSSSLPPTDLGAPTDLTAVQCKKSVCLKWKDNATQETKFEIERGREGGKIPLPFSLQAIVPKNTKWYADTAVERGYTYKYRVRAANQYRKSPYSNTASVQFGS